MHSLRDAQQQSGKEAKRNAHPAIQSSHCLQSHHEPQISGVQQCFVRSSGYGEKPLSSAYNDAETALPDYEIRRIQHMPFFSLHSQTVERRTGAWPVLLKTVLLLTFFSALAFLTLGYHPGFEDDGVYLAAVERRVHPELFPYDFHFFTVQLQATIFDRFIAAWVRLTHMSIAWSELLWQCVAMVVILTASRAILRHFFRSECAQWAGVAMLGAMFSLPVSGTALYILDQHLHPRALSTALILMAVAWLLEGRRWSVAACLLGAFFFHPIMGAMGMSFCFFLLLAQQEKLDWMMDTKKPQRAAVAAMPLGWVFEPPTAAWRQALHTRTYYFPFQWQWYEWLGALAPIALFWLLAQWASRRGNKPLARFAAAVVAYSVVQQGIAVAMTAPPSLIRLIPLQPMRFLHLVYLFLALMAGALLGEFFLRTSRLRWACYLVLIYGGMFASQRAIFADTVPVEWPEVVTENPWVQAFTWIRGHTPKDAYFAIDPWYLKAPGEDYHNFRPLAERSVLADGVKDAAVCTQVPELADVWLRQRNAQEGLNGFTLKQFEELKRKFGVDWVLVSYPANPWLDCRWHNRLLTVCRIP